MRARARVRVFVSLRVYQRVTEDPPTLLSLVRDDGVWRSQADADRR